MHVILFMLPTIIYLYYLKCKEYYFEKETKEENNDNNEIYDKE